MSMNDPVADMLTRIRNACRAKHRRVDMPASKLKAQIAQILKDNAYITDFRMLETEEGHKVIRIILKYVNDGAPVIRDLQRVSSPGLRKYVGVGEIPRVRNGLGMAILSTSQGIMSDSQARKAHTGGELLAYVW